MQRSEKIFALRMQILKEKIQGLFKDLKLQFSSTKRIDKKT